jgi:hypothetical protein
MRSKAISMTTIDIAMTAWYDLPYIREIVDEQHENVSMKPSFGFAFSKDYFKQSLGKK